MTIALETTELSTYLKEARQATDATLDRLVPTPDVSPERIHEAMRYSLFAGGKRVRPALVLLTGEALGVPRSTLLPGGAALEMIHTYSLIHDDLPSLDNDDLRRGRPTCHRQFDEATAILAGDALLTLGLTTLAVHPDAADCEEGREVDGATRRRAVAIVGEAIGTLGMIGGQVDDLAAENQWPDDAEAALESIHRRKTGALLTVCVRLAGLYAGASEDEDALLTELGEHVGLLFQIADDILDISQTSEVLGKTAGKDAAVRKLTYPGLYGLDEARLKLAATREAALELAGRLPGGGRRDLLPALVRYIADRDR